MMITVFPDSANIWRTRGSFRAEPDVSQPHPGEGGKLLPDRRDVLEEGKGLVDRHVENVRDRLPLVGDLERLPVVPLPPAHLARDVDVPHEVHLDLDDTVPLARLAPAALDVERIPPGP